MKKFIAILLAALLVVGMTSTALADKAVVTNGTEAGKVTPRSFTLNKEYQVTGGNVTPNETVTFAVTQESGVETVDLTVGSAVMTSDDTDKKAPFTLTFGEYTKVGKYVYKITEVAPNPKTLGVTYDNSVVYVVVTITNAATGNATENQLVATVAVHRVTVDAETKEPTADNKIDPKPEDPENGDSAFINKYDLGKLTVTKEVSGNLASFTKPFTIHVTFTDASGLAQGSEVSYTLVGATAATKVTLGASKTIDIELKNGDSVTFENIPAGITYTVVEDESHTTLAEGETLETSEEGYTAEYTFSDSTKTIAAGDTDTAKVSNTKETTPDTGIFVDSLPYVLIAAGVIAAVGVMVIRKRREMEG